MFVGIFWDFPGQERFKGNFWVKGGWGWLEILAASFMRWQESKKFYNSLIIIKKQELKNCNMRLFYIRL